MIRSFISTVAAACCSWVLVVVVVVQVDQNYCELPSAVQCGGVVVGDCLCRESSRRFLLQRERKMARGKTRGHKGGRKQFSNPDQIKDDMAKEEEKRLWREQHPDSESEESSEEEQAKSKECFYNWSSSHVLCRCRPEG